TWAANCKKVLEKHKNAPMSQKDILNFIQKDKLKEISSGVNYPLNVLGAMLYSNARTTSGIFYKVPGKLGVYKLKKSTPKKKKKPQSKKPNKCGGSQGAKGVKNSKSKKSDYGRQSATNVTFRPPPPPACARAVSSRLALRRSLAQSGGAVPSASPGRPVSVSQQHSRKALKQALKRQQQQTQRRGVVVSAGKLMSRLILTSCGTSEHTPPRESPLLRAASSNGKVEQNNNSNSNSLRAPVLAQTTSLAIKRRLPSRPDKLDAGEFKRGKDSGMDVESPDSVLVNIDLKALINRHTFAALPSCSQRTLLSLLPLGDGQVTENGVSLKSTALNNEFFNFAAGEWTERLGEGEFTPEMQLRMRQEQEKAKPVEQWKERFFENYYGEKSGLTKEESRQLVEGHCEFYL
uniref:ASXL transcriptional regulator 2 n=1 Tax=Petromyzon marinus TaxID=7757 RepID=S4R4Y9_PETMA